jgi:hypothetical protein
LQRLQVKRAIVELAFSSVVAVDTLPLAKHLSRHDESPRFSASCGNTHQIYKSVGALLLNVRSH